MQEQLVFAGFGGQGVMFAGQILAYAAMDAGYEVTWIPSYGPEMRGGTAHCFVVISDKPIGSPMVGHPKIGVIFNIPSFTKYEPLIAPDGLLTVNSSLVKLPSQRHDIDILEIPATDLAESVGTTRLTNMVMLGAILAKRRIITHAQLREALEIHIPAHRRDMLPANYEAIEVGEAFALSETEPLSN